jgi:coenzyme F420-reducing hydrogenase gamma subunit
MARKPSVGVFKFSSCDGCQLSILDAEDQLLPLLGKVELRDFLEATSSSAGGPYDLALVEGSITSAEDVERITHIRKESGTLVAIGACATAGGIQALRNWGSMRNVEAATYHEQKAARALEKSLPVSDFVRVDAELRGCPVSKGQLVQFLVAMARGAKPRLPTNAVCFECKRAGNACVVVAGKTPCLGPVTAEGCGAICPSMGRGCYGCFGPSDDVNLASYVSWLESKGVKRDAMEGLVRMINSNSKEFRRWLEGLG